MVDAWLMKPLKAATRLVRAVLRPPSVLLNLVFNSSSVGSVMVTACGFQRNRLQGVKPVGQRATGDKMMFSPTVDELKLMSHCEL